MPAPAYNSIWRTARNWDTPWSTVKKWCVADRIPGVVFDGGRYRIPATATLDDVQPLTPAQLAGIKQRQMAGREVSSLSGYRGVYPRRQRWAAIISIEGRPVHIGTFDTAQEAAKAWDQRALELRGPDAWVNFQACSS